MRVEWVNHASFIVRSGQVSLVCDPWLEGKTFNEGWSLLSPTKLTYDDFASISHIWFSHEHPDHFNPPNLSKIPEEYRRRIKVLFHYTKNKRVVNFCKSLGFQTEELPEWHSVEIGPDFRILSGMQGLIDSWCVIFAEGKTLSNMNDCTFERQRDLEKIKERIGNIDVLLSQFSYANWVGNPADFAGHKRHAEHKIVEMSRQIKILQPAQFIPSSSHVFFSHSENCYMNRSSNRVGDVFRYVTSALNVPTVVLYPGDQWVVGTPHDSAKSIADYDEDFARALETEPTRVATVDLSQLEEAANVFVSKYSEIDNQLRLNVLPPAVVYLTDLDVYLELSFRTGLRVIEERQVDIILSSDSLLNCLSMEWGGEALVINGRFQLPAGGKPRRFFWIFRFQGHRSTGSAVDLRFLSRQTIERARVAVRGQ